MGEFGDRSIPELEDILRRSHPGSWWVGFGSDADSRFGEPEGDMVGEVAPCLEILGIARAPSDPLPKAIAPPPNLAVIS